MKIFQSFGAQNFTVPVPKGSFTKFDFSVRATFNAQATLTQYTLGQIFVKRKGQQICPGINWGDLLNIRDCEGGALGLVNTAQVFTGQAVLSWQLPGDNNALKFEAGEGEIQFIVNPLAVAAFATCIISVVGTQTKTTEKYVPVWNDFTQTLPATGRITPEVNNINIDRVYVRVGANFGDMQIEKDNDQLVISDSFQLIQDTAYQYRLEALPTYILTDLNRAKNFGELVSNQVKLYFTAVGGNTGDGTILYQNVVFDIARTMTSKSSYDKFTASNVPKDSQAEQVRKLLMSGSAS